MLSEFHKKRQEHIFNSRPLPVKKTYSIPKKSEKRIAKEKEQKEAGTDIEMDLWFIARRREMKNRCLFCGAKTERDNDDTHRRSIAHLLPKRPLAKGGFPSVRATEHNWIELCHYGNSCHTNFDNGMITWEFLKDSKEWDIISEKLLLVLPQVAEEERKNKLYDKLIRLVYGEKDR